VSSVLQTPSPENKQYDTAPPPPEKSAARTDTKDSGKASPTGGRAPSAPEVKASSAERGSAGLTTVSRTVGPGDQAAPKSSPPEGAKDVSGSAGSSSGKVVYTVQAGAFRSQKDAEALKRKLEAKKYKALIKKEADAKGVFFFKVRSGEFENRKEASVFALKLKKTDGLDAFAVEKK
jgi:cell division septation protein DedD